MAIDDPLDQAAQRRDTDNGQNMLSPLLNIAGPLLALLTASSAPESVAATTAGVAFVWDLIDSKRQTAGASTMIRALVVAHRDANGRLDGLEAKLRGLDAEEAFVKGARASAMTARLEKARRIGQVLGSTLAQDSPNWVEAAEFIATLEEFGDNDIRALKTLWVVQRAGMRVVEDGQKKMSTDANDYTSTWKEVLSAALKAALGHEEWYSQCGRLTGFGLVLPVQPNQAHQGPGATCYRLTTKAVRLLNALGYRADPSAYPKWIYKPKGEKRLVQDHDEHLAAGDGWFESPQA